MTKAVQRRRGTNAEHSSFTGLEGELSVNTTNDSVHVHDGATAGGFELARADGSNVGNLAVGGDLDVTGNVTIGGNITIGDADTDSININADLTSSLIPNADDTYDLGSASKQWRNLYVNGAAEIDSLSINGIVITATAAEINYLDGVTSNIQTQLDAKAPIDAATFTGTTTIPTADINGGTIDGTAVGASTPSTGSFTDTNAKRLTGNIQALGSISGTNNIDVSAGDTVTATITAATTFTVSNLVTGKANTITMYLTNPGAGTITWPSGTVFNLSGAPTLPASGNTIIVLETYDNGTSYAAIQAWRSSN